MSDLGDQIRHQADLIDQEGNAIRQTWADATNGYSAQLALLDARESDLRTIAAQVDAAAVVTPPVPPPVGPKWTAVFDQTFKGMAPGSPGIDMNTIWADWGAGNYGDGTGQTEDSFGLMRNVKVTAAGLEIALRKEDYNCSPKTPNPAHWTGARFNTRAAVFVKGTRLEARYALQAGRHGIWTASPSDDGEYDMPEQFYGSGEKERYNGINDYSPVTQKYKDFPVAYGKMTTKAIDWCTPANPNDIVFWLDGVEIHRIVGTFMPATGHVVRLQVACGGKYDAGYGATTKKLPPPNERAMVCEYVRVLKPT